MNIHHLELFYYVAKYGGISEAVRNIPYGIQQPAISSQILQLEAFLGTTLFQRRPFALTAAGQQLFSFIRPFFGNLTQVADTLRGLSQQISIGASDIVLRDHLPVPLQNLRQRFSGLKLTLRSGYQPQLEKWLQAREIDLAVTLLEGKPPAGIQSVPLLDLPLLLVVPKSSRLRSAADFWKVDRIEETLICLPSTEPICKRFREGLGRLGVDWLTGIEVSSLDLIHSYVANGYGVGLSIAVPHAALPSRLRGLLLEGFAPVTLGALWWGKLTPLTKSLLDELQARARQLSA